MQARLVDGLNVIEIDRRVAFQPFINPDVDLARDDGELFVGVIAAGEQVNGGRVEPVRASAGPCPSQEIENRASSVPVRSITLRV